MKIVELDAPPTQNRKVEILKRQNVRIPEGLVYVPIELQKDDLREALRAADLDWRKDTLRPGRSDLLPHFGSRRTHPGLHQG